MTVQAGENCTTVHLPPMPEGRRDPSTTPVRRLEVAEAHGPARPGPACPGGLASGQDHREQSGSGRQRYNATDEDAAARESLWHSRPSRPCVSSARLNLASRLQIDLRHKQARALTPNASAAGTTGPPSAPRANTPNTLPAVRQRCGSVDFTAEDAKEKRKCLRSLLCGGNLSLR